MQIFNITSRLALHVPDNYAKKAISWFNQWVAALESGKFPQAKGMLAKVIDDNGVVGYCCLGVACKVQGRLKNFKIDWEEDGTPICEYGDAKAGEDVGLSARNPLYQHIGSNGKFPLDVFASLTKDFSEVKHTSLANLNDGGATFAEIAQVLRILFKQKKSGK